MNTRQYKSILASSSDPTELSRTVQGIIIGASSIIMFFGLQFFHVVISQADVTTFAASIAAVVGGIMTIYGLFLKILNTYGRNPN